MSFLPSKWVIYAPVALLPFLAALVLEGRSLQTEILNRVTQSLSSAGSAWAKPAVDGRDVILSGDAPSAEAIDAAIAAAVGTPGVRLVDSTARIASP